MLDELFGETGGAIAQFILALIVVLILILIVAWLLKKLGGGRFGATNSGQAELSIVDTLAIDPKRRLVLVRHGKLEHLLLIGGGSDEVVERSIIGGLPITARMQANKPAAPAPEKPAEPPARPSSMFLDRLERTSAARKSTTAGTESTSSAAAGDSKSPSADPAAAASSPAPAEATSGRSAYATMIAATSRAESKTATSPPGAPGTKPVEAATPQETSPAKADAAMAPPMPVPAPEPIDLPPLPKSSATPPASAEPSLPKPASSSPPPPPPPPPPAPAASAPATPPTSPPVSPLPKSEREALDQSLDAALHDSLLTPEPAAAVKNEETTPPAAQPAAQKPSPPTALPASPPVPPSAEPATAGGDDMDFNLFDDGELEREMEAALADTANSPTAADLAPELAERSMAAIEAELAIDLEAPPAPAPVVVPPAPPEAPLSAEAKAEDGDQKAAEQADDQPASEAPSATKEGEEETAKDTAPPYKDIPVELSRPDPVPIQIPSRGPAANATSVTKADNGISSEAMAEGPSSPVDLSQLLDTSTPSETTGPETAKPKPASGKGSDLDEEMRRLLGEIAGDPKTN